MGTSTRQQALLAFVAAAAVIFAGIGLFSTGLLGKAGWGGLVTSQIQTLAVVVVCAMIASVGVARFCHLGVEALLLLGGFLATFAIFGPGPTFAVVLLGLSSLALGIWWRVRVLSASAEFPVFLDFGIGLALLGMIFYALSPFAVNTRWLHTILLTAPIALALYDGRARAELATVFGRQAMRLREYRRATLSELLGYLSIAFVLALYLLCAALPDRGWDAMAMHLRIASSIANDGAWAYDIRTFIFAQMPILADVIYGHLFLFGGEKAARLGNLMFLAATCNLLYLTARSFSWRSVALMIVALFVSIPLNEYVTASLLVENALAFWIVAAVTILLRSGLRPTAADVSSIMVLLAAGALTKLHGALAATVIGAAAAFMFILDRENRKRPSLAVISCLVFGTVALTPYLAAYLKTGNPFFPFFNHIFKSAYFLTSDFSDTRWMGNFSWSMPYQMVFNSRKFGEVYDGVLGIALVALLPLGVVAVIAARNTKGLLVLLAACALFIPIALSIQYFRYLFPVVPLLVLLIAYGFDALHRGQWTSGLVIPLGALAVASNIALMPTALWSQGYFDLRAALSSDSWHDLELRDLPERVATSLINELAGKNTRVLYTSRPVGALLWGTPIYWQWYHSSYYSEMEMLATEAEAAALLQRLAITHVIVRADAARASDKALEGYLRRTAREPIRIGALWIFEVAR